jgi:hypothetical protein
MTQHAMVLIDEPDEERCESHGWVEATVSEATARDLLAEYCADENGNSPARPQGEAKLVWLRASAPAKHPENERWAACEAGDSGARKFYEFDAQDVELVVT